jgi:hypothetical protein
VKKIEYADALTSREYGAIVNCLCNYGYSRTELVIGKTDAYLRVQLKLIAKNHNITVNQLLRFTPLLGDKTRKSILRKMRIDTGVIQCFWCRKKCPKTSNPCKDATGTKWWFHDECYDLMKKGFTEIHVTKNTIESN